MTLKGQERREDKEGKEDKEAKEDKEGNEGIGVLRLLDILKSFLSGNKTPS